jgi:hypothetical protein
MPDPFVQSTKLPSCVHTSSSCRTVLGDSPRYSSVSCNLIDFPVALHMIV